MSMLTISWCKDLKNCVPFHVIINGNEVGIIRRGESIQSEVPGGEFTLRLVPKAPRFFGWKAVQITADTAGSDEPQIELSIIYPDSSILASQLHITGSRDISVISEELCKKY